MKLNQTHRFSICSIIKSEVIWRYNHMSNKVLKPKKASLYEFTQNYSNNINNCIEFFKSMKWPDGFSCDHCRCHKYYLLKCVGKTKTSYVLECSSFHKQQSLLSSTIFQSCKLDLYKLLLQKNHRLLWLNIIIGNIKNNITGIYHGITKREMPLFLNEQEYRFNHRKIGKTVMDKIKEYLQRSFPISHRH